MASRKYVANLFLVAVALTFSQVAASNGAPFRGALLAAADVSDARLGQLRQQRYTAIALMIDSADDMERQALERITQAQFPLYYWIEIGRSPSLADAHPQWMASVQGHPKWRRLFDDPPTPSADEVVKVYPWVPILYREAQQAHLERVKKLLADLPAAKGIFLNDLQGPPSACGCGNTLCRWTADYGPIKTATALGDDAAARFVASVQQLVPKTEIIPVWITECEQHDGAKDGHCAGVGCFTGICWKAYAKQISALEKETQRLGVLLTYKSLSRDLPVYGRSGNWASHAIKTFSTMLPPNGAKAIKADRLVAVVQGWDITDRQLQQQLSAARQAGSKDYLVAISPIEQSWLPRIYRWNRAR